VRCREHFLIFEGENVWTFGRGIFWVFKIVLSPKVCTESGIFLEKVWKSASWFSRIGVVWKRYGLQRYTVGKKVWCSSKVQRGTD